ncbi:NIPSNAP family protein [Achromobacter sp. NPDC058515]|uniref:NIPSNAP family protein n=1 Tax=Achromobacter sp. NPDC058515 TaxID=3346533 RepID=UPI003647B4C9
MKERKIVDFRVYTMCSGGADEFLRLAKLHMLPVQVRHLGQPLAFYKTEIGQQEEVMHLWGFQSLADMEQRRAFRDTDSEWGTYLRESDGLIARQENTVLYQAPLRINQDHARCDGLTVVQIKATTVKRGRMKDLVSAYEESILPVLDEHRVGIAGIYTSEVGSLNRFVQITAHENYGAIESFNQNLAASSEWLAFRNQVDNLIVAESTQIARKIEMS